MDIEIVANLACQCGERPVWDEDRQRLYFTDNETTHLYCFDVASEQTTKVYEGDAVVGAMTLHEDGRLLLFMARGAIALWTPGGEAEPLLEGIEGEEGSRFNDVVADPSGRVFCGTMPDGDRPGWLYRWDPDGTLHTVLEEVGMPNGMGFSPDLQWFYLTDTRARAIDRFRYDASSGELSHRERFISFPEGEGDPDGLAIDSEGCLWSALFFGGALVRHDPEGCPMTRIRLPMVNNPTCPVFAGEGSSMVYVTSAGGPDRPESGEAAGSLLRLRLPALGGRVFPSRSSMA